MRTAIVPSLRIADAKALALGNTMLAALTGNTHFPTPSPDLTTVQNAIDTFSASLAKAKYGGRDDKAEKGADKKHLINLLRELCNYINGIAQGNLLILSSCGCPLSKEPQPIILGTPQLKVKLGISGQLVASSKAVKGAVAYKYMYTANAAGGMWSEAMSTKATYKINGLVPGTLYSVQIIVIGTNSQLTSSSVVTQMVV
jgi:hypothetical protein